MHAFVPTSNNQNMSVYIPWSHYYGTLLRYIQVIKDYIIERRGWTWGSEAGPQPITLKGGDSDGSSCDGVEVLAVPDHSPQNYWRMLHVGRKSVSFMHFC